jgi:hypothetical protein
MLFITLTELLATIITHNICSMIVGSATFVIEHNCHAKMHPPPTIVWRAWSTCDCGGLSLVPLVLPLLEGGVEATVFFAMVNP